MTRVARTLARIPLFRTLDPASVRRLDGICGWREARAKQWIVDRELMCTEVYFVLHGTLRVIVSAAGRETILRDLRPGEYFGELAALDGQPRSAGILAVTDATLAAMPAAAFRRAIDDHPDVCDQILAVLVGQIRMLANRANEMTGLSMKQRLWAELLRVVGPVAHHAGGRGRFAAAVARRTRVPGCRASRGGDPGVERHGAIGADRAPARCDRSAGRGAAAPDGR